MNPSESASLSTPVAIIGMGCLFPRADGLARYWTNIRTGVDAIAEVPATHWSTEDYFDDDPKAPDRTYARRGGFLDPVEFPPLDFGISPTAIEATDTTQLLGLMVARQALEDAGYGDGRAFDRERVSVILGVTGTLELAIPLGARLGHPIWRRALDAAGVDPSTAVDVVKRISDSYVGWQEASFPGLLGNVAAGRIANRLDLRGTNCVVDAACGSSLGAIDMALLELATGRSDLAVTGGLDTFNDIFMYMCFSKTPALSPTGEARPFDAEADGTILGEGLGVVVLKRLADARRDGDRVYAVIRSIGTSSDGKGQAVYAPSVAGQVRALRQAYRLAGVSPATVGMVEAHGTGTRVGDAIELEALEEVYRSARPGASWCALGSVKSQVGHTKAAAGAAGLIKAAMALHQKVLPPTLKVRRPADRIARGDSPFYLSTEARPWLKSGDEPRRAGVSAFGFGGSNFHCVLEEAEPEKSAVDWDGDVQILAISADDPSEIVGELESVAHRSNWDEIRSSAARLRASFRADHRHRLTMVLRRTDDDRKDRIEEALARLAGEVQAPRKGPARVFLGEGPRPGRLALMFPGQGSQYVGMLREIACLFPRMQAALHGMNETAREADSSVLASDRIYPPSTFDESASAAFEEFLRETRFAQPAIGAISRGLLAIVEDFGLRGEMAGGHSFGELSALRAAGRIGEAAHGMLAHRRGGLMADAAASGAGAMLAVFSAMETVETAIRENALDVVIANRNAPRQCVISGPVREIDRARRVFSDRGIATRDVAVSAAFHSRFVAGAREPFRRTLELVEFVPGSMTVFANATAAPYPDDPRAARDLLAGQLARPVEFVAMVEAMYQAGARTFLEVGPDAKLSGLVRSILEGRDAQAIAIDASRGAEGNVHDLACALATLAALGYAVNLNRWDDGHATRAEPSRKVGLTVRISGANSRPAIRETEPDAVAPPRSAIATATAIEPAKAIRPENGTPARSIPSEPAETDRTMNPTERPKPQTHTNGEAHPRVALPTEPATGIARATADDEVQASLAALQRMAERTAELHRMFLEGQERTQQALLKLLEHQDRKPEPRPVAPSTNGNGPVAVFRPDPSPVFSPRFEPAPPPEPVRERFETSGFEADHLTHEQEARPEPSTVSIAPALIAIVAEKTGYPPEVLDLEMRLDEDLGIDSIKRVEILSTFQERHPDRPVPPPDRLGSLPTLRAIAEAIGGVEVREEAIPFSPADTRSDELARALLETVAEKTGYPAEMLELDMKLDDDLGIDSIKRVEIFSALQERCPGMPEATPDRIGTLATLREIVAMMAAVPSTQPVETPTTVVDAAMTPVLLEAVAEKTGYPVEMLELDMKLDDDLGIDSIKRVEILSAVQDRLPGTPTIGPEQTGSLRTLREIVEFLAGGTSVSTVEAAPAVVEEPRKPVEDSGLVLRRLEPRAMAVDPSRRREPLTLPAGSTIAITDEGSPLTPALQSELTARGYRPIVVTTGDEHAIKSINELRGLVVLAPSGRCPAGFVDGAFRTIRASAKALEQAAPHGGAAMATVSRLDGRFGVEGLWSEVDPTSGALAGLSKTAAREWSGVSSRALDLGPDVVPIDRAAAWIVDELLTRGPAEIGLDRAGIIALEAVPARDPGASRGRRTVLRPDDLVVISGGARGITAEVAVAMATAFRPRLLILGRSQAPEGIEDPKIAACRDESELKRMLLAGPDRPSPRTINDRIRRILSDREIRANLARITEAGSRVAYRSVDVRDPAAVGEVIAWARDQFGPVRGLIHGAGVLADRKIVDQTDEQFSTVFETKVGGLHNLVDAIDPEALALLILFSSSTARYGRTGQVAYASANEYLNKWAQQAAIRWADCRVVSFNWGPWDGGMVGEALRSVFEGEGLHLIPPDAGARLVVDEVCADDDGPGPVEIVVLADRVEDHPKGAAEPVSNGQLEVVFQREVNVRSMPVLADHVIDGHAVLPMAILLEWAAEAATHRNPGLVVRGVEDLKLFKGVVLHGPETAALEIAAGRAARIGDEFRVPVEIRGSLRNGRPIVHARAEVVLAVRHEKGSRRVDEPGLASTIGLDEVYGPALFHGPAMQGIERVEGSGDRGIVGRVRTSPAPSAWLDRPLRSRWLTDPLAVDSAFQLVVLWTREQLGSSSLPTAVGRYRQFRSDFGREPVRVVAVIRQATDSRAVADIEFLDGRGEPIARIDSYECVVDASLAQAFRRNRLAAPTPMTAS